MHRSRSSDVCDPVVIDSYDGLFFPTLKFACNLKDVDMIRVCEYTAFLGVISVSVDRYLRPQGFYWGAGVISV